jgi:hypothetical protein
MRAVLGLAMLLCLAAVWTCEGHNASRSVLSAQP